MAHPSPPPFLGKIFYNKPSLPSFLLIPLPASTHSPPSPACHPPTFRPPPGSPPLPILPILPFPSSSSFLKKAAHAKNLAFCPSPSCHPPSIPSLLASLHSLLLCIRESGSCPLLLDMGFRYCVYLFVPLLLPFTPPPRCLGSSRDAISISFEFNVSCSY